MLSSKNIFFIKNGFHPTCKHVGFTPQFITIKRDDMKYLSVKEVA